MPHDMVNAARGATLAVASAASLAWSAHWWAKWSAKNEPTSAPALWQKGGTFVGTSGKIALFPTVSAFTAIPVYGLFVGSDVYFVSALLFFFFEAMWIPAESMRAANDILRPTVMRPVVLFAAAVSYTTLYSAGVVATQSDTSAAGHPAVFGAVLGFGLLNVWFNDLLYYCVKAHYAAPSVLRDPALLLR